MRTLTLASAAAFLGTSLAAQVTSTNQIVGWTQSPVLPVSGQVQMQDVDQGCKPANFLCSALLSGPVFAGGTAYDPRHQAVWISDNRTIELLDLTTCKTLCSTTPHMMDPNAVVSGLAVSDHRRMLYQLETREGYLGILPYFNTTCPPTPTRGGCTMTIHPRGIAAGIAYDEVRDLLYYTVSFPGFAQSVHELYVAKADDRCNPVCMFLLPGCEMNFERMTGLAYDSCTQILYATTGDITRRIKVVDPFTCNFQLLDCCKKQSGGGNWAGLSVVPGWTTQGFGRSCLDSFCPQCPNMLASLVGDPSLGNQEFAAALRDAPARENAFFLIGFGGCHKGIQLPFMCEALFVPLGQATVAVGPLYTGTGPSCTGQATVQFAIPPDSSLCGQMFCCQWGVTCTGTKPGLGISNAIHFTIASS